MAISEKNNFKVKKFFKQRQLAKHYDKKFLQNKNIEVFKRNYDSIVPHIYIKL